MEGATWNLNLPFRVPGEVGHPPPQHEFLLPKLLYSSGSESYSLREPGVAWLSWPILKAESMCVGGRVVRQMAPRGTAPQLCLSQVTCVGWPCSSQRLVDINCPLPRNSRKTTSCRMEHYAGMKNMKQLFEHWRVKLSKKIQGQNSV